MTPTEKIITTVQRYCLYNIEYWRNSYIINKGENFTAIYQISKAVLGNLETLVGKEFSSVEQCYKELELIILTSRSPALEKRLTDSKMQSIRKARQNILDFVNNISVDQIKNVESLPYRRRMPDGEANEVRLQLQKHWGFDGGYWEPLTNCSPKPFAFFDIDNLSEKDIKTLAEIILRKVVDKIYEISEDRHDYEIEPAEFDPNCHEIIYTGKNYEWIFYRSHEGTIAFGGDWLLAEIDTRLNDKIEQKNIMLPNS